MLTKCRLPGWVWLCGVVALSGAGCSFDFRRDVGLQPGDVKGRALREGQGAPFAKVSPEGSGRLFTATSSGDFVVRGLGPGGWVLRLTDDEDGDGWPERAAYRAFALRAEPMADGLFGESEARLGFVLLGEVSLEGVVKARGTVRLAGSSAPVPGARVYALRGAELPGDGDDALEVELAAEAVTASDDEGRFTFPALAAGRLTFVAIHTDDNGTRYATSPTFVDATEGSDIPEQDLGLELVPAPQTRRASLRLAPAPGPSERVRVFLLPVGSPGPDCDGASFDLGDPQVFEGAAALSLDVPVDVFDLHVCTSDGRQGALPRRVSAPPGSEVVTWGLLQLSRDERCFGLSPSGAAIRDCDHDGVKALPAFDPDDTPDDDPRRATWAACGETCYDGFGSSASVQKCVVEGEDFDCDDDGDGQPDMTEPFACQDPFAGNDADGDGLCDFDDPYPQCASNDPSDPDCGADRAGTFTKPAIRPEYGGAAPPPDGGSDDGGIDAGSDGGVDGGTDAGLGDGGVDGGVDGGFDAGPVDAGPGWPAVIEVGDPGDVAVRAIAPAPGGGVFLSGEARTSVDVAGCPVQGGNGETGTPFFALLDRHGACRWLNHVTPSAGAPPDAGFFSPLVNMRALAALPSGDVLAAGNAEGASFRFDGQNGTSADVPFTTGTSLFVVRYSPTGEVSLLTTMDLSGGYAYLSDVAAFADGSFVVTGDFNGTLQVDAQNGVELSTPLTDAFVVGVEADGTPAYAFAAGNSGMYASATQIAALGAGATRQALMVATFDGQVSYGQTVLDAQSGQTLLVSLDAGGAVQWATQMSGISPYGTYVAASAAGERFVVGGANSQATYTPPGGPPLTLTNNNSGAFDGFVFFLDRAGAVTGTFQTRGLDSRGGQAFSTMSFTSDDDLVVAGGIFGPTAVPGPDGDLLLTGPTSNRRAFAWRVDPDALPSPVALWEQQSRGGNNIEVADMAVLDDDSVLVAGYFEADTRFGGLVAKTFGAKSYLWRIGPAGESAHELLPGLGADCTADDLCADERCDLYAVQPDVGYCTKDCQTEVDCPEGWACDGFCIAQCTDDASCLSPQICHPEARVCVDDCNLVAGTCAADEICDAQGICHTDCRLEPSACAFDERCGDDGICRRPTVTGDTFRFSPFQGGWSEFAPLPRPPARRDAASTTTEYPEVSATMLIFGGADDSGRLLGDTWQWEGFTEKWSEVPTMTAPTPREGAAMALHIPSATVLLFGGWSGSAFESDVWLYDTVAQTWTELSVPAGPEARAYASLAYEPTSQRLVLFGGLGDNGYLGDTWLFDMELLTWTQHAGTEPTPPPRSHAAVATARGDGRFFLVGGFTFGITGIEPYGDTWQFDGSAWSQVSSAQTPPARGGAVLAHDGNGLVLFGGDSGNGLSVHNDLWQWDAFSGWYSFFGVGVTPPALTSAASGYDGLGVVVFGGDTVPHAVDPPL